VKIKINSMKRACLLISVLFLVFSCKFTVNESNDKEFKDGFKYDKKISTINGNFKIKNNELIAGEFFVMEFKGVENATLKDGFKHVGIAVKIIDGKGTILEENDDLLSNIEQQRQDYDKFLMYYGVPYSMEEGEKIIFEVTLFDKYGDVSYDVKEEYTVTKKLYPPLTNGISIETNSESENIGGQVFFDNCYQFENTPISLSSDFEITFYLIGLNDFDTKNGFLNANYSFDVIDSKGEVVFNKEDVILGEVDQNTPYYNLNFSLNFTKLNSGNYKWVINLKDNKSNKFVKVNIDLKVE